MKQSASRTSAADPGVLLWSRTGVWIVAIVTVVAIACVAMNTSKTQSPVWFGPYLSAAANLQIGAPLQIDLEEVRHFAGLSIEEREGYSFSRSAKTTTYDYNDAGFAYLVALGKVIFFWMSDQAAIEAFQISVHALSCALIIVLLPGNLSKTLFFFMYAVNPFVIYFVTFPFYYFWQAVPSIALVMMMLGRHLWGGADGARLMVLETLLIVSSVLLGITLAARPTTIVAIVLVVGASFWFIEGRRRAIQVALTIVVVAFMIRVPTDRNFWHTAYVGIGAWENDVGVNTLSDDEGYALYAARTGEEISASLGGNMYQRETMAKYREVTREAYQRVARSSPWLLIRNSVLNTLQSYSLGHLSTVGPTSLTFRLANYLSALVGLGVLLLLLATRQFLLFFAVGMSVGTFSIYFPPIPAYMYGAYLLLVIGMITIAEDFWAIQLRNRSRSGALRNRVPTRMSDRTSIRTMWRTRPGARV